MEDKKSSDVIIKFVGHKVSRVRWCPNANSQKSDQFVTGGYGNASNDVTWWNVDSDLEEPKIISQTSQTGSVTDMCFVTSNQLVTSSDRGQVSVQTLSRKTNTISTTHTWTSLHSYEATKEESACTCLAVNEQCEIVTGGEDGRLNLLQLDHNKPVRTIDNADSSNVMALTYLNSKEVVSVNTTGQVKLWDVRTKDEPSKVLSLSGNACPILSIDKHPNQQHILVTGHSDGVIGIWDVRQDTSPVTLIEANSAEVWEVRFHPQHPDNLFTCSEDGSCWFWDGSSMVSQTNYQSCLQMDDLPSSSASVWLYVDANKKKLETFSLLPFNKMAVNSFDLNHSSLVCSTDAESIMFVHNLQVR